MRTIRRRRKEKKTNYTKRIKFLKSEKPRLVFRKTNQFVIGQYVLSSEAQDKVSFGVTSKKLLTLGWPEKFKGSLKSIPASYLVGYYLGKKIQKDKLETPIVDFGMSRMIHKTKVFGFLKGIIDSGLEISCKEEAFPEEERIKGANLKEDFSSEFEKIKLNIEATSKKAGLKEGVPSKIEGVKA